MALVDLLVASLLLCIGVMGLVSVYNFAFNITVNTDDIGIAYNLGRAALENQVRTGYTNAIAGTTTTYYNGSQVVQATAATARYKVVTVVASSSGLVSVAVTVSSVATGNTLYQTNRYLVQAGI